MRHPARIVPPIALIATLATIGGSAVTGAETEPVEPGSGAEDPFDMVYEVVLEDGRTVAREEYPLPEDSRSDEPFELDKVTEEEIEPEDPGKIHPLVERWIEEREPGERVELVVNFVDPLEIPRFPAPADDQDRDSAANLRARAEAEELIAELEGRRAESYERLAESLRPFEAEVLETFWLIHALRIEIPLAAVPELAQRQDVLYLQPRQSEDPPPQNANNADDVADARARIVSDPYFNLGLDRGWIALLDTGVRRSHELFNRPGRILLYYDCVHGGARCNDTRNRNFNPADDCWNHGTQSAGVLSANNRHGDAFRGVTGILVDSFKVYPTSFDSRQSCNGGLDSAAAVRGFQRAIASLDRVILAEIQSRESHLGAVSTAADRAFDAGAVVVAANGNDGPDTGTVNAPASAHRVLGVGAFDVQSGQQYRDQSRGPASDRRTKPDVQAPSNTETASNLSDTDFSRFTATSGAAPYAAAAAALLRNWMRGTRSDLDPGYVYATMIVAGQGPLPFDNTRGAGPLRLPTDGFSWRGKVAIGNRETRDIPLGVGENMRVLDAALWWPEGPPASGTGFERHDDIDLYLIDPAGTIRTQSLTISSVFERARVSGNIQPGTWKLRVRGYRVSAGTRPTVYWSALSSP